jgi:hypothetical protein
MAGPMGLRSGQRELDGIGADLVADEPGAAHPPLCGAATQTDVAAAVRTGVGSAATGIGGLGWGPS